VTSEGHLRQVFRAKAAAERGIADRHAVLHWEGPEQVEHGTGDRGDPVVPHHCDLVLRQGCYVQVNIAAYLAATRLVPGEVHPGQLTTPGGEPVQNCGRHVAHHPIRRSLHDCGGDQPAMTLARIEVVGRCLVVRPAPDPLEGSRSGEAQDLVNAPAVGDQVRSEFDLHGSGANSVARLGVQMLPEICG
jgi:hypothetical protein